MNGSKVETSRRLRALTLCSFSALTLSLLIVFRNSPAGGYELSIYDSIPPEGWILLGASIVLSMAIFLGAPITGESGRIWAFLGYFALIIADLTVISLPIIRGYYLYTVSDPLGHLEFTQSVIATGHADSNYYPITHILGAAITDTCKIRVETTLKFLPIAFTMVSVIFTYLLAREILGDPIQRRLAAAIGTVLLYSYYHISAYPQALSLMTFPLFFYVYFKLANNWNSAVALKIALIALLFLFPFFHPATETVLVFSLVGGHLAYRIFRQGRISKFAGYSGRLSILSMAAFIVWLASFGVFGIFTRSLATWLGGNISDIPRSNEIEVFANVGGLFDQVVVLLKMYGSQLALLILSVASFVIVIRSSSHRREPAGPLSNLLIISLFCGPTYLLIFLALGQTTIGRLIGANTLIWVMPVLSSFALVEILRKRRSRHIIMIVFVSTISILSILTVYRSPWILQPNMEITYADSEGAKWQSTYIEPIWPKGFLGWPAGFNPIVVPAHFGYDEGHQLGDSFGGTTAIIITDTFTQSVSCPVLSKNGTLAPGGFSAAGFTPGDLEALKNDSSVNLLYVNGEFSVLLTYPSGMQT